MGVSSGEEPLEAGADMVNTERTTSFTYKKTNKHNSIKISHKNVLFSDRFVFNWIAYAGL